MPTAKTTLGTAGEAHARRFLEAKGFRWIESNWRCRWGELDLVMMDGDELALIEVKTRRSEVAGSAEESVSASKGRKLLLAAQAYLQNHPALEDPIWRVDLVAISLSTDGRVSRLSHIENAVTG